MKFPNRFKLPDQRPGNGTFTPICVPDQPQLVILRGNNRAEIFCAEADYRFYLEKLKLACDKHCCSVHADVLMTNHVHLLITPHGEQSLAKAMQMLGRYYVQYYNYSTDAPARSGKAAIKPRSLNLKLIF